ncbi:aromatic amino acid lyase, partial [Microbispora rosea]|uniref:aromatic amino acid lyase n=1 Tax=Microbispora rosea TaxID=58117 RepID=UPI00343DBAB1
MSAVEGTIDLSAPLRSADLRRAAAPVSVVVDASVRDRVERGRGFLRDVREEERPVYGATTGFGALVGFAGREEEADQCDNTLAHLGAGQGPDLADDVSRAAILVRTWSLAQGASGVSAHVVDGLAAMFTTTFVPAIPRYGSVGASGDLIPLAYAAQALRGRGQAYLDGSRMPAAEALRHA